jgi:hypothetical protein
MIIKMFNYQENLNNSTVIIKNILIDTIKTLKALKNKIMDFMMEMKMRIKVDNKNESPKITYLDISH